MILHFLTSTGRVLKQSHYSALGLLMIGTAYGSTLSVPPNVTVNVPTTYTGGTIGAAGTLTNNSTLTNTGVMTNVGGGSLVANTGTFVNAG
ncbi:MAG: hypothetical protein K2X98_05175, partial [Alphaproteobacteria bacterium]|nr:hypothetical protein [Alphaproteobacteria bacterium]